MPKSLVEKLAEVVRGVDGLLKLGDNGEYAYLRILDISNALREKLFAAGILIIPNDCRVELRHVEVPEQPGRWWTEATVTTKFVVRDGTDQFEFVSVGHARDMDAKCVAIAQTAALKSFLKRLALIFGDYDDPEVREETIADLRPDLQRKIDEQTCITRLDIRALYSAMKKNGHSLEQLQEKLTGVGLTDPMQIMKQDFPQYMGWALNGEAGISH